MDKSKILVVEDTEVMALHIERGLKKLGYSLAGVVASAVDALEKTKEAQPDLVLMDISLEGDMDGIEAAEKIYALYDTPVVYLTSSTDLETLERAKKADPFGYIIKPFEINTLQSSIEMALFKYQSDKKLRESREDLKKTVEQLKITQNQLLQQEKMASIGQLAAGVAHEINNPMGFITSNLSTLKDYMKKITEYNTICGESVQGIKAIDHERVKECVQKIEDSFKKLQLDFILGDIADLIEESLEGAGRVRKIVTDLKSFSHQDDEKLQEADINQGLLSTINIVWNELKYKATLTKELGDLPLVRCYPQKLNQVFMNILINAGHAIEEQGEIRVKSAVADERVFIEISDTGCGIPQENINRIFEPFFTTKEVGKGTGMGLSLAYDIIHNKHGGEITIESHVGKGTTFRIHIPINRNET